MTKRPSKYKASGSKCFLTVLKSTPIIAAALSKVGANNTSPVGLIISYIQLVQRLLTAFFVKISN